MRFVLVLGCLALAGCRDASRTSAGLDAAIASCVPSPVPPSTDIAETDFRGSFNGVPLWGTLEARGGSVSGSCFYESVGVDIPLRGSLEDNGAMALSEIGPHGPVSTITLTKGQGASWIGTWKKADGTKTGPARLQPIKRRTGEPVVVATRHVHKSSLALCDWSEAATTKRGQFASVPAAPCEQDARVPVVLGLDDRGFQKKLNRRLAEACDVAPPPNPVGLRIKIDYFVPLNERGFITFVVKGDYLSEAACDRRAAEGAECSGVYAHSHTLNVASGLTAAVDGRAIASSAADFMDVKRARSPLIATIRGGQDHCVTGPMEYDPLEGLPQGPPAVLSPKGVSILYDNCAEHVHTYAWAEIPFARLRSALRAGSIFEPVWSKDGG